MSKKDKMTVYLLIIAFQLLVLLVVATGCSTTKFVDRRAANMAKDGVLYMSCSLAKVPADLPGPDNPELLAVLNDRVMTKYINLRYGEYPGGRDMMLWKACQRLTTGERITLDQLDQLGCLLTVEDFEAKRNELATYHWRHSYAKTSD